ncbi:MAG TPA: MBL fold metallo-hydrolase [Casimicrobiaceae bacterium]|nr:MBL fold metallo-hydrolase [Casimicrobiaceae bacterium]
MLVFRQLFDPSSSTYTYLLGCVRTREAVLIDPVFDQAQRDAALVRELGLHLMRTLETHVHADHVTGAWMLKQMLGSRIVVSRASGAEGADDHVAPGDRVRFGEHHLEVRATPGHTAGCVTYVLDDRSMAFTGDTLLIRGTGRTDFQQGDPRAMFRSVRAQILSLPDDCLLYPAHDYRGLTVTSVAEERRYNPRLGGEIGEEDFVGYMNNLGLPHPKQMAVAVPANMKCGHPEHETIPAGEPDWAPLTFTFAGIWQIEPQALAEAAAPVQIVDVREPEEFTGPLGHIKDARLIPLPELGTRVADIDRDRPTVLVCRSGARSAHATVILQRAGHPRVANMAGGMLRWRAEGHPVVAESTPPHLQ